MYCLLSLVTFCSCCFKVCFSHIRIATPVLFWLLFAWNLFPCSICLSLDLKWVSCSQHIVGSFSYILPIFVSWKENRNFPSFCCVQALFLALSVKPKLRLVTNSLSLWLQEFLCSWRSVSQSVSSVTQLCPTLCDPMNRSMPGFPVHDQLPEFTQTHVHRVGDAIQPSHPLSSPSPAPNPSQHQGLFRWVNFCMRWPKYWSFNFSKQSLFLDVYSH